MATIMPTSPETLIAVKVAIGTNNRRFKLPLRELGANVFESKLRFLLAIPPNQQVIFERYSDSAGAYIKLDSNNPSIYKQVYRAAKAKLKLRIKATVLPEPQDEKDSPTAQAPVEANTNSGKAAMSSPSPNPMSLESIVSATPSIEKLPVTAYSPPSPISELPVADEKATLVTPDAPVPRSFFDNEINGQALLERPSNGIFSVTSPPPVRASNGLLSTYTVFCNNCNQAIPDAHYHCSTCQNGDYDLCQTCIDSGVLCGGTDHWLIKRFLQNGNDIRSTTETIAPRKTTRVQESGAGSVKSEAENEIETSTRTCNCCIEYEAYPESNFVTCLVCEDYDLCIPCHFDVSHGHNPAHGFEPVSRKSMAQDSMIHILCKPGRDMAHAAVCDGCDTDIRGVRHKCLECPDWDYCSTCIASASDIHPYHRFVPIYDRISIQKTRSIRHPGIYCDGPLCKNKPRQTYITGVRYKCAVCHDTDFCAGCEATPVNFHNKTHPLIKFKTPVRNVTVSTEGAKGNGEVMPTMGDLQSKTRSTGTETSSVPSSNAATQVQTVADLKPSEDVSKKVEGSKEKLESANAEDYQAHFVCDIVPDGVALPTNTTFKQVWTLVNVGSVPWPVGCCVKFVGGDNMRNIDPDHPFSIFDLEQTAETINTDKEVLPGQEFDFAITLRTAKHLGKSISYWRLTGPDGHKFGHKLWCEVNVCDMSTSDIPNSELPSTPKSITTTEPNATQPMQPTVSEQSQEKLIDFEEPQPNLQGSEMIFPKLDRESPVSSQQNVAEDTTPLGEADDLLVDDVASLKIDEDSSEDGFLTDEEYDILNASDEEFLQEAQKAAHP